MEKILKLQINSYENCVSVIRVAISTFISEISGITIEDIMDVKTSISEAVTNCVEHGYEEKNGMIDIICKIINEDITIVVKDYGKGIEDISLATTPAYTSKPQLEHAGLGFTIMENFMDSLEIDSKVDEGTTITMFKRITNKRS